jgi:peptidoglycan/LPS O-acetylase OafA/YrhL
VLIRFLTPRSARFGVGLSTALWALFVGYVALRHDGELDAVTSDGIFRIIPEFTAGFVLCRFCTSRPAAWAPRLPLGTDGLMVISVIALGAIAAASTVGWMVLLPVVIALVAALYAGGRATDLVFGNRVVVWLGELSFAIYMVHVFVQICFNQILRQVVVIPTPTTAMLVLCIEIAVTIVVALAASRLVEVPARRWIVDRFSTTG